MFQHRTGLDPYRTHTQAIVLCNKRSDAIECHFTRRAMAKWGKMLSRGFVGLCKFVLAALRFHRPDNPPFCYFKHRHRLLVWSIGFLFQQIRALWCQRRRRAIQSIIVFPDLTDIPAQTPGSSTLSVEYCVRFCGVTSAPIARNLR
uniref:Uncharacterized protein n=1 Tax=Anopheles aquasalis TaxID=42839 RepID=T1E882_ANOAQ